MIEKGLINHFSYSDEYGRCNVPQEQINTWHYINRQKLCARVPINPPHTETELDCLVLFCLALHLECFPVFFCFETFSS